MAHTIVKRLISRFASQGFRSNVGRVTAIVTSGAQSRVALLGRLSLFGRREGPLLWRVQNKTIDKQNVAAGTEVLLHEKERRARVEVSLGSEELREMGIRLFKDLQSFRFTRMQGRYFSAMLPTFSSVGDPVQRWREDQRRRKFLNTGVLGLTAMDEAVIEQSTIVRSDVVKRARANGNRVTSRKRVGRGARLSLVAYEELNRRFQHALGKLTRREQRGATK